MKFSSFWSWAEYIDKFCKCNSSDEKVNLLPLFSKSNIISYESLDLNSTLGCLYFVLHFMKKYNTNYLSSPIDVQNDFLVFENQHKGINYCGIVATDSLYKKLLGKYGIISFGRVFSNDEFSATFVNGEMEVAHKFGPRENLKEYPQVYYGTLLERFGSNNRFVDIIQRIELDAYIEFNGLKLKMIDNREFEFSFAKKCILSNLMSSKISPTITPFFVMSRTEKQQVFEPGYMSSWYYDDFFLVDPPKFPKVGPLLIGDSLDAHPSAENDNL